MMANNNNNTATTNNNSNSNNNNNPFVGEGIGNGGNDDDDEHAQHQLTSSTTTNDMEPSFSNSNNNDLLFEPSRSVCSILVKTMMIYKKACFTYVFLGICGAIPAVVGNWIWFTKDFESKLESWINDGFNITIIPHGNGNSTDTHTHNGEDIIDGNFEMIWDYLSTIKPLHFLWIILIGIAMYILSLIIRVATIRTTIQVYCNQNHAYKNSLINLSKAILTIPRMIKLAFIYWSFIWGAILIVGIASLIISGLMWLIIGNNIIKTLLLTLYHVIVHCIFIWFMYCCMFWNIVYVVEEKHREDSNNYHQLPNINLGYSNLIRPFMRSYYLVKQQWWFVFFGIIFFNMIFVFVLIINSVVFYHLPGGMIVVFIMQTLTMVIFTPLSTIYYVVLYVNARIYNSQQRQLGGGGDDYDGEEFNINILADDMKLVDSSMMTNLNDIMHDEEEADGGGLTTLTFTSSTTGATTNNDNALDEPLLRNVE